MIDELSFGGLYIIECIPTNKIYIGQTKKFKKRKSSHFNDLKQNRHSNNYLQNEYNKYGPDAFVFKPYFVLLENADEAWLNQIEEELINEHYDNHNQCFNIVKDVSSLKWNKKQTTEEYRQACSERMKKQLQDPQMIEAMKKIPEKLKEWYNTKQGEEDRKIKSNRTKTLWSDPKYKKRVGEQIKLAYQNLPEEKKKEMAEKLSISKSKQFSIISPDNVLYESNNISKFAEEHGLLFKNLSAVILGASKSHKGWRLPENVEYNTEQRKTYDVQLISPEGIIYGPIFGLNEFARQHSLFATNLKALIDGKLKTYKGWRRANANLEDLKRQPNKNATSYSFQSPEGIIYENIKNKYEFEREHNLKPGSLSKLTLKKQKQHKGWILIKEE